MITFWTTRVSAIFEIFIAVELLLSGRLVPLHADARLGAGRRRASCPSSGRSTSRSRRSSATYSTQELLGGLAMQVFWIVVLTGITLFVWRFAVRRYSAVGN